MLALDIPNGTSGCHTLHFGDLGPQTLPPAPSAIHRRFSPQMILFWLWLNLAKMGRMAAIRSLHFGDLGLQTLPSPPLPMLSIVVSRPWPR